MASKGRTFLLLLTVAGAALAKPASMVPGKPDFKDMAKKLMMKCQNMGYQMPKMMQHNFIFNSSDLPVKERNQDLSSSSLSTLLDVLNLATDDTSKDSLDSVAMADSDETSNKMWNCTKLRQMIRLMRNSSGASACYIQAVVAPMSWTTLTTPGENNMDSDDYDAMVWAAKPALQDMPPSRLNLPPEVKAQYMEKIMDMMRDLHDTMSDQQRACVVKWVKEQITQNYFNCTMMPPSDSGEASKPSEPMERCNRSLKWLNLKAMKTIGPYLSRLTLQDVDSSPREKLCEFFQSARFKSTLSSVSKMNPSLSKKFLKRIQECYSGKELAEHADKLGTLACYYDAPDLPLDLSKKLLSQLDNCDNPGVRTLRKRLVQSVMSNSSAAQSVLELGSSVTLLSPMQLSALPDTDLKAVLKNMGPNVPWSKSQLKALVMAYLGGKKCKEVTSEELIALQSVAEGLPSCVLKRIRPREILDDPDALRNISKRMRRGQLKAMLLGLREDADPSELLQKLSGPLLQVMSLNDLMKTNSTFWDQVEKKTWSQSQAAYLAKRMDDENQLDYRKLRSVLQGVTCKMFGKVADRDTLDMAQAITETPEWLSKVQAMCASRKLFSSLEKERADYFKTITEDELDNIPTLLLLHLQPAKVKDLPDSVCPVFLNKMEVANLSSLPVQALSRPALLQRALRCLSKGKDLSELTTEDVSRLGQLLCELSASQLRLMNPNVTRSSLRAMATCPHIPQRHRADLIQLLIQTFKDPSDWSAETMEVLGPLLLLDDNATSALPNKPWMKDVLYFLKSRLSYISDALKKKLFDLTITPPSNAARRKRAADSNSPGESTDAPTMMFIEELGMGNVFWTPEQMEMMSTETFISTVEILGRITEFSADQLNMLQKKVTEIFGQVSQITESVVMQMGCITRGFSNTDLETLPLSLDAMEDIADCGWMESQMQSVWTAVAKYNNLTSQGLGAAEMVMLNQFICGLNQSEIRQLNKEAFKDAVGSMGDIRCPYQVAQQLKSLAVSAFGDPSTWTEAHVSNLGNIVAGLDRSELASLKESVCPFLSKTAIPLIPADNFAALSVTQLEALGPDNAAMVTTEQQEALGDEQLAALQRAETGSQEQPNTGESGAPSLTVEGISAFMKPLLFFLIGLLLL